MKVILKIMAKKPIKTKSTAPQKYFLVLNCTFNEALNDVEEMDGSVMVKAANEKEAAMNARKLNSDIGYYESQDVVVIELSPDTAKVFRAQKTFVEKTQASEE